MASSEWEEVKKLAMDFQRTQQMSSVQKLSERNCVDIVKRLIEMKLLDVIFTNDGKEYLTGDQLTREIENELYAAGGRVAISELVGLLNVDYSHVEAKAHQLVRTAGGGEVSLVLEQLISRDFKDALAAEIDLHLQEVGTVAVSELSKSYDLPAEFLLNLLEERLDILVKGKLDREARVLYTHDYLARFEAKIIGVFSALTRPIALQTVVNRYGIAEKILTATLDSLLNKRRILGTISGPTFIPEVYSKTQQEYVVSFYKHNRYLDYSTLAKLGISNGRAFLEKKFGGGSNSSSSSSSSELIYLNHCAVDRLLAFQIETTAEEVVANGSFAHLLDILPSVLTSADAELLIRRTLETGGNRALLGEQCVLLEDGGILVSRQFLERAKEFFAEERQKRAEAALRNGLLLAYFSKTAAAKNQPSKSIVEEKHSKGDSEGPTAGGGGGKKGKKGSGGGSGNAQGREVKTKAVKKKYKTGGKGGRGGDDDDDDEQNSSSKKATLVFMSLEEITQLLSEKLASEKSAQETESGEDGEEVSEALVEGVAALIAEDLQRAYEATAREVFVSASAAAAANQPKQMSFAELQKATVEAYAQILLFDKGIQVFESADLRSKLVKYLQRTLCSDVVNNLLAYFAFSSSSSDQLGEHPSTANLTSEARAKMIGRIGDAEVRDSLGRLNNSIAAAEIATFITELEAACPHLDILLAKKGVEKRREKVLLSEHRQLLLLQLQEVSEAPEPRDPILGLHIAVMLIFQATHEAMLHTSGKLLPAILSTLAPPLVSAEVYIPLKTSQELVLSLVAAKDEAVKRELTEQLLRLFDEYRPKVIAYRRPKKGEEGEEEVAKVAEEE